MKTKTTKINGHSHQAVVDKTGYGMTSEDNGHKHPVIEFRVLKTHGHTHKLEK